MKKIVLTGGGTAGHVTPNIALLPSLKEPATRFSISVHIPVLRKLLLKILEFLIMVFHPVN